MTTASLTASLLARKGHATASATIQPLRSVEEYDKSWLKQLLSKKAPEKRSTALKQANRIHKSLYLNEETHHQLRLLAARTGTSQQYLMEQAVVFMMKQALAENGCICSR